MPSGRASAWPVHKEHRMSWLRVELVGEKAIAYIGDEIGFDGPSADDAIAQLHDAKEIELIINSSGGCSETSHQFANAIRSRTSLATITGNCCSGAVVIC